VAVSRDARTVDDCPPDPDPWEVHATWWQDGFTDGADAEYVEQILPLAAELLAGYDRVLDVGAGEGQVSRLVAAGGASTVVGVDPTAAQASEATARGGGPSYLRAAADDLPFDAASFDAVVACLVFEHIEAVDEAIGEVARVLRPGGRFAFFLNHPLLQTPGSGWIDDQVLDPPEQYWRIGPYLVESMELEEVDKGVFLPFVHRPLSRYINALADHGLVLRRMHEPAPPDGFLDRAPSTGLRSPSRGSWSSWPIGLLAERAAPESRGGAVYAGPVGDLLLITGLSGAGRSEFSKDLEDLGWFVIDRLPPDISAKVAALAMGDGGAWDRVAFVLRADTVGGETLGAVAELRSIGDRLRVVFLNCSTEALVRRYESSRRPHPFPEDRGLEEAIRAERELMEPVRAAADLVLDTSDMNVHELRDRVAALYGEADDRPMRTTVTSFGYKHGLPRDADLVFDCRFLPNPHWIPELRPLSGLDGPVREHVLGHPVTQEFLDQLEDLLSMLLPAYVTEGKSYLSVALGCTGGRHRSVAVAETVAEMLRGRGFDPAVSHRDVDR